MTRVAIHMEDLPVVVQTCSIIQAKLFSVVVSIETQVFAQVDQVPVGRVGGGAQHPPAAIIELIAGGVVCQVDISPICLPT